MFQEDVEETDNTFFVEQGSSTMKSILKTSNIDNNNPRKRISFSEKATKVYQDNETSQISLAKSSSSVKSSDRNVDCLSTSESNSSINNQTPGRDSKRSRQEVGQITPKAHETSFSEESPSIIESSFQNDSFSSCLANSKKNFKKFRHKPGNHVEIQHSTPVIEEKQSKKDNLSDNYQTEPMETELNTNQQNSDDVVISSNIFSDELVQTFMSQIMEKDGERNSQQISEDVSFPFLNFALTLPGSISSEESLDAQVRMAINISKDSNHNPENKEESKNKETDWNWKTESSTEIIPSSVQCGESASGWMQTPWEDVRGHCNASDNSSFDISLLFNLDGKTLIPGASINENNFKMNKNQGSRDRANVETDAIRVPEDLWNPYQQDRPFCDTRDGKNHHGYLDDRAKYDNTANLQYSYPPPAAKQQVAEKESVFQTYTILENATNPGKDPSLEVGPSSNQGSAEMDISPRDSYQRNQTRNNVFERSDEEIGKPNVAKLDRLVINTSSSIGYAFNNGLPETADSNEMSNSTSHEPKLLQNLKKNALKEPTLRLLTPNKIKNTNQQHTSGHPESEPARMVKQLQYQPTEEQENGKSHIEMELKKLDSLTSIDQVREGMINIRNRFQETLLAGHWLTSGLQRNAASSSFPSLKSIPNWEVNKQRSDENKNSTSKAGSFDDKIINMETTKNENFSVPQNPGNIQNLRIDTNIDQFTEIAQIINSNQRNVMGHPILKEPPIASRILKSFTFSALTLSDTQPVREKKSEYLNSRGTIINDALSLNLKNVDSCRDSTVIREKNPETKFGEGNDEDRINHLGASLIRDDFSLEPCQMSKTFVFPRDTTMNDVESTEVTSNVNYSGVLSEKIRGLSGATTRSRVKKDVPSSPQNTGDGESYKNYQTEVDKQGPNQRARNRNYEPSSTQPTLITSFSPQEVLKDPTQNTETMKNTLNASVTKRKKSRPKKKNSTPKQNSSSTKNKLIPETHKSGGALSENSQKLSQSYSKTTKMKSSAISTKAFGHMKMNLGEAKIEEIAVDSAQNESSLIDEAKPRNIRKRAPPKSRKSSQNCTPNPTNKRNTSREGIYKNFGERKEETLSETNHSVENKKGDLDENINPPAMKVWTDSMNFDFFNLHNVSEDNSCKYQPSNATMTERYHDENSAADREQYFDEMDISFEQCSSSSLEELLDGINCDESPFCGDTRTNQQEKEIGEGKLHGNPAGHVSMTRLWGQSATRGLNFISARNKTSEQEFTSEQRTFQSTKVSNEETPTQYTNIANTEADIAMDCQSQTHLSWGQSATCGLFPISTRSKTLQEKFTREQSTFQPAQSANTSDEGTLTPHINIANSKAEIAMDWQSETPLTWGKLATCRISPTLSNISKQQIRKKRQINQQVQEETPTQYSNITNNNAEIAMKYQSQTPLAWGHSVTCGIPSTSETEAANVVDSAPLPQTSKTEEEEIEEILNGIEFVRVPEASEFIKASSIEELINDQCFEW
ncbi:hypothetical protein GE061_015617 [Apolygus lucorum]|uniref:Uncharacterized protein n=1 Tax=Apolygus lucorum TaxID=248454 RepID=A0A8S9XMN3_APOLU|nr:hypothetical protein GE061_015617 [Apolygus lucorum]